MFCKIEMYIEVIGELKNFSIGLMFWVLIFVDFLMIWMFLEILFVWLEFCDDWNNLE